MDILVFGSDDLSFYGLNADTGVRKWICTTNGIAISSPAISVSMGRAYWGTNGWDVQGHNLSDGATEWSYTCGSAVRTSPALANGVVFAGCGKDHHLYGFRETFSAEPKAGAVGPAGLDRLKRMIWQFDTGGDVLSSPAISDGMVFIGSNTGELSAFGL
jgi:outer membrane protein assembly factor BamB